MRRFFTRFGTGGTGVGSGGKETDESYGPTTQEKVGLATNASPTALTKPNVSGDRVRAIAQRYEVMNGSGRAIEDGALNGKGDSSATAGLKCESNKPKPPQTWYSHSQRSKPQDGGKELNGDKGQKTLPSGGQRNRSPLFRFDKPLPRLSSQPDEEDDRIARTQQHSNHPDGESRSSSVAPALPTLPLMDDADGRIGFTTSSEETSSYVYSSLGLPGRSDSTPYDAAGSSGGSSKVAALGNGSATAQAQAKSVAFAPSPKKPARPTSPDMDNYPSSMPSLITGERMPDETLRQGNAPLGSLNNFAKPTLASSARARSGGRQSAPLHQSSGSASASVMPGNRSQGTEKFPSAPASNALNRASLGSAMSQGFLGTSMKRSNSAGTRRAASGGATSAFQSSQEGGTLSGHRLHSSGGFGAAGSATHLQTARETSGSHQTLPNSIPFVNAPTLGMLRSASPQSMATASSIRSGPGATPDFFSNPRRASFQGRHNSGGSSQGGGNVGLAASSSIRSIGAPSWSEMTQEDLVSNLGSRERTRQEVLWEIVASEERYVQELEKTKDFFLDTLLHPNRSNAPTSPGAVHAATLATLEGRDVGGPKITKDSNARNGTAKQNGSSADADGQRNVSQNADLPIAARFMSATSMQQEYGSPDAAVEPYNVISHRSNSGRDPYHQSFGTSSQPVSSRPQSSGAVVTASGSASASAAYNALKASGEVKDSGKGVKRWSHRRSSNNEVASSQTGYDLTNGQALIVSLPTPVRLVLEAIDDGIFEGHALLSEALRVRYEEQWPLVRTLADVFTRFGYVFKHYRSYVVNLERALDCLEEAALMERAMRGKRLRKDRLSTTVALGRAVASLDSAAAERGECGLAIFLAMPFQRLLKYPLLFQNLLFHTDASTFEFENTVQMVVDVERIIRSIEDEKVNKEERDKTIDAFARIEGIKDRALLRPKADRVLIEERATYQENPRRAISESTNTKGSGADVTQNVDGQETVSSTAMSTPLGVGSGNLRASIRSKRSYRRLSDLLTLGQQGADENSQSSAYTKAPNVGSKRDIWLVRFSDVELRCQRVGVTALPMISSAALSPTEVSSNATQRVSEQEEVNAEEERMREEFKRTRESKERLRALRNTTLRSKTRNLYKFIGVSSWKATRERPNMDDADGLDGLATAHEEDEEAEGMDEDDDDSDGAASDASHETEGGLLDPELYIRQSKLSFSYGGHDRVEPKLHAQGRTSSHGSAIRGMGLGDQKRHSMGSSSIPGSSTFAALPSITVNHANVSSRHVAATSRLRSDKFGARLRNINDEFPVRRGSMPNVVSPTHAMTTSGATSNSVEQRPGSGEANERAGEKMEEMTEEMDRTVVATNGDQLFQKSDSQHSFVRDQSIDSNLYMMGALVQHGTAQ